MTTANDIGIARPVQWRRKRLPPLDPNVLTGDATLFMRHDAVEAVRQWVTRVLDDWGEHGSKGLPRT